ncbi:hypothetical protein ACKKBG_A17375 [Auxenochlorella protothecoides x Auxenochlorella symbiontica]
MARAVVRSLKLCMRLLPADTPAAGGARLATTHRSGASLQISSRPAPRCLTLQPDRHVASCHRPCAPPTQPPAAKLDARTAMSAVFPPPPPLASEANPLWTDDAAEEPCMPPSRRIFCNRSLNMAAVRAVGFDMDYTLAQYKPETFEVLAHDETVKKLVSAFGYPKSLLDLEFDWRYMSRGLVIDKQRGNMLKVDRHKYVKLAYHGFSELPRAARLATYNDAPQRHGYDEPAYALIDTLFSLAEAHLFMQLVELLDAGGSGLPLGKQYADLYRDVRGAVDLCHRDGSIKREVAADPARYIHADPSLGPVLGALRASGKRVFLATNSLWDYTHVVMNYLVEGRVGAARSTSWLSRFDVVVTGCGKPRFFAERKDLFEVHPPSGMLWNTEGGSPMVPIGEDDLPSAALGSTAPSARDVAPPRPGGEARVFQGGSFHDLHKMLGVAAGSEVLYVGDHIYGDVLRSKKALGWRTMLVIPELESELQGLAERGGDMAELRRLRRMRDAVDDRLQRLQWRAARHAGGTAEGHDGVAGDQAAAAEVQAAMDKLQQERDRLRGLHQSLLQRHHEHFHPVWGQVLKTGYQNSRYAHQIERFACLYTSHVANLMFYSPDKSYKARPDTMCHEDELAPASELPPPCP